MLTLVLNCLLHSAPSIHFSNEELQHYEQLSSLLREDEPQPTIDLSESVSYPPHRFLHYLSRTENYLFHGSNNYGLETLEPREQTLYNDKLTKAVFASGEAMWSIFYAVLHREKVVGNFRNGCIVSKNKKKFHFYSLTRSTMSNDPWTSGMLFILPKKQFQRSGNGKVMFDEWVAHESVKPLAKISVSPDDFYFKDKVALHAEKESIIKTWLLYKMRVMKGKVNQQKVIADDRLINGSQMEKRDENRNS